MKHATVTGGSRVGGKRRFPDGDGHNRAARANGLAGPSSFQQNNSCLL
jgi:hypothetical protein